jgi:uncharacterized membrane protein
VGYFESHPDHRNATPEMDAQAMTPDETKSQAESPSPQPDETPVPQPKPAEEISPKHPTEESFGRKDLTNPTVMLLGASTVLYLVLSLITLLNNSIRLGVTNPDRKWMSRSV